MKLRQIVTSNCIGDYRFSLNVNQSFHGVFTAKIEQPLNLVPDGASNLPLKIFYPSTIPCWSDDEPLKIHIQFRSVGNGHFFDVKSLRWWLQAYFIGSKDLLVGIHEKLILNRVLLYPLDWIRKQQSLWNGRVCFAFLHSFLDKVKRTLDSLPEGAILIAIRKQKSREFQFVVASAKSGWSQNVFFGDDFLGHNWK